MIAHDQRQHRLGLMLVALAALAWSSSGIFVRLISADLMTMLFWRGLFSGASVMILFFMMEGRRGFAVLAALRWPAYMVMLASTTCMIAGIGALRFTTVAEALIIYATVPFVTAAVAWASIGERPALRTIVAGAVAITGVGVMLQGASWDGSLFGKLLAVIMAFGMAAMTTIMRRYRDVPMLPAMGGSAWLCSFCTLWFAAPLGIGFTDLWLCALFGILQNGAGLAFYGLGSKKLPAAEAALVAALEVPMTPFWVWLLIGETPPTQTLVGGLIVFAALFGHLSAGLRWLRWRPEPLAAPER
jgi:drug/metabolite transporter (DMT)-like permease